MLHIKSRQRQLLHQSDMWMSLSPELVPRSPAGTSPPVTCHTSIHSVGSPPNCLDKGLHVAPARKSDRMAIMGHQEVHNRSAQSECTIGTGDGVFVGTRRFGQRLEQIGADWTHKCCGPNTTLPRVVFVPTERVVVTVIPDPTVVLRGGRRGMGEPLMRVVPGMGGSEVH